MAGAVRIVKLPITLYQVTCETPNHFYVGISGDVAHRFRKHRMGKGATFTTKYGAKSLEVIATFWNQEDAQKAEKAYVLELRQRTGGVVAGASQVWSKW